MSTKFSIRPAPRKRPWICKRSPPCLKPPPFPPSLIASWSLQRLRPPPQHAIHTGSLVLTWQPLTSTYDGASLIGAQSFLCVFQYDPLTALAHAWADWSLPPDTDWGPYPTMKIPLPPNLIYDVYSVNATLHEWRAELTITG